MVKFNCAALPSSLIESELFGHEKGAFTGAVERRIGRFELADGGTVFLDEIGDLTPDMQVKLLRVLEDGEFERLGSTETIKVNVRILAATNRDLDRAVADGSFREDLYYRIGVFPISLPPLRERPEDIPLLAWLFITKFRGTLGKTIDRISKEMMDFIMSYEWPGNVRELENVIERTMILSLGTTLSIEEADAGSMPLRAVNFQLESKRLDQLERAHIVAVLEECGWRVKGAGYAAEQLGLKPSTLFARIKKHGIKRP
jgi:transcriptional regulator with GAF, ATPase, and Fis domain